MEPASVPETLAAIAQQLHILTQSVQALEANQTAMQVHQERLEQGLTSSGTSRSMVEPPTPPLDNAATGPEPYVSPPEKFDGDRKQFRCFITSCQIMFSLQRRTYNTDFARVRSVISLLIGRPQRWAHHLLRTHNPVLNSWSTFYEAMEEMYDDPHRTTNAAQALDNLKQGRNDVEEYITDFKHLALESEWNEPALIAQFRKGLSEALKDELARTGLPSSLDKTMSLCIDIDRRIRERRAERASTHPATPTRKPTIPPPYMPSQPTDSGDEPMQVGAARGPLTEAERSRRRSLGLCMYCGRAGHQVRECREKPNTRIGKPLALPAFASIKGICTPMSTHLIVPLSLQWDDHTTTINAMIDSGASSCFLDTEVIQTLGIPTSPKKQPYPIQLLDGSTPQSGPVTKETIPLLVTIG
uniref:CCHC-type domain-containing protein n=1 Tax=Leptobrachium leishanense TaxID=445787 RepID=A0A8C5N325_9ANUR